MAVRDRYCIHLQSPVVSGVLSFCTVVPVKTDCYPNARVLKYDSEDFPSSPVVKVLPFHFRVHRFNPWSGN